MKFKPILGSDLSGHVGGVVASHNTYGPYFRQRVRPVNKKTVNQQAQRSSLATISASWRSLDPTVQAAWVAASVVKTSKKGDRVTLTGQAAFMYVNTMRQRLALSLITSPPSGSSPLVVPPGITTPTVSFSSATTLSIYFSADAWNATDGGVIVSGGLLTSSGISFKTPALAVAQLTDPGTGAVTVTLPFAVPIGARLRLQFHATQPDGVQTTYVTVDTTNTAFVPPAPTALSVLSVTLVALKTFLWQFDGPVGTATPGADATLDINGDTSGIVASDDPHGLIVTYTTSGGSGMPYTIATQPTCITMPVKLPQTGVTV